MLQSTIPETDIKYRIMFEIDQLSCRRLKVAQKLDQIICINLHGLQKGVYDTNLDIF